MQEQILVLFRYKYKDGVASTISWSPFIYFYFNCFFKGGMNFPWFIKKPATELYGYPFSPTTLENISHYSTLRIWSIRVDFRVLGPAAHSNIRRFRQISNHIGI